MAELTQEYFDRKLTAQTAELKSYADQQTDELARIVGGGFDHVEQRLDKVESLLEVKQMVEEHERKLQKLAEALQIKL